MSPGPFDGLTKDEILALLLAAELAPRDPWLDADALDSAKAKLDAEWERRDTATLDGARAYFRARPLLTTGGIVGGTPKKSKGK